ncbi:hypothetical protein LCGC14_2943740, partial [marine sediment metagenome]
QSISDTEFIVKGLLLTPEDGVYYTSDKKTFLSDPTHKDAKTSGSYLYYDSDLNGFYETVFVLAPDGLDGLEDKVYNVMAIGYNYDGSHDFIPYDTVPLRSYGYGSLATTGYSKDAILRMENGLAIFRSNAKDLLDSFYPPELTDGTSPKDYIFDISQMVTDTQAGKLYPELYNQVYNLQHAKAFNEYETNLWNDVREQVTQISISGYTAAIIGMVVANWLTPIVFGVLYFFQSYTSQVGKALLEEQRRIARTFYPMEASKRKLPNSLNSMRTKDVDREGIISVNNGHEGAYYTPVFGGEFGNMYDASVIASPPASWRFVGMYSDEQLLGADRSAQLANCHAQVDPTLVARYFNFNLDYFLITSELPALEETLNAEYS